MLTSSPTRGGIFCLSVNLKAPETACRRAVSAVYKEMCCWQCWNSTWHQGKLRLVWLCGRTLPSLHMARERCENVHLVQWKYSTVVAFSEFVRAYILGQCLTWGVNESNRLSNTRKTIRKCFTNCVKSPQGPQNIKIIYNVTTSQPPMSSSLLVLYRWG